jgi:hypothetical protein
MKKLIVITLLITFCSVFAVPQKAEAGGAAEGAIIGAAIGAVIGLVWWAVSSAKENPQKAERLNKEKRLSKGYTFIPDDQIDGLPNYPKKVEQQAVPLYSFKVEF